MPQIQFDTAPSPGTNERAAPEPRRAVRGTPVPGAATPGMATEGTARPITGRAVAGSSSLLSLWNTRHKSWQDHFNSRIRSSLTRYWELWRNYDATGAVQMPGEEWRDRTVIPEAFKVIESRLARLALGMFGRRDWIAVKGVEASDAEFEEIVRKLLEAKLGQIGRDSEDGDGLIVRAIEGMRYEQIVGHVWWRIWWRSKQESVKVPTLVLEPGTEEPTWREREVLETVYDGLDVTWLPVDSVAFNLIGPRVWTIEKVRTTLEALIAEDEQWFKMTGQRLYRNLVAASRTAIPRDSVEEPRDTEHWPLEDESRPAWGIGETPIELWLCWDHRRGTLTKIVNGKVIVAHGRAPTPDGRAPYFATKAVPVPNRAYGDSILNWTGPLHQYQTRIARARMDEILLSIWQQYIVRTGVVRADQLLFRPGGHITVDAEPGEPLDRNFAILPRRPVFQEAWTEEGYRQRMAESTAATDAVQMGAEATTKSRDVTATEIQQRILQGGARHQLDILYHQVAFMRPLLQRSFRLIRQNMSPEAIERIVGRPVSIEKLRTAIDLKMGGGLFEMTREERLTNINTWLQLAASPVFQPFIEPRTILEDFARWQGETDPSRYLKKEPEPPMGVQAPMPPSQPGTGGKIPPELLRALASSGVAPGSAPAGGGGGTPAPVGAGENVIEL